VLSYSVYYPYEMVDLQKELSFLRDYVGIQNIRFGGRVSCDISCAQAYARASIPKLIVQPIVENAFAHGFEASRPLCIALKVYESEGVLLIQTLDNGPGMEGGAIDALNARLEQNESPDDSDSIGLLNVNRRLKNTYGKDYGLKVDGLPRGLSVTIRLPLALDGGAQAGGVDD